MVSLPTDELVEAFALTWNKVAKASGMKGCIPTLAPRDPTRKKKILACLDLCADLNTWRMAFQVLASEPFYTGGGPRGWRADLSYVLWDKNRLKILEMGLTAAEDKADASVRRDMEQRKAAGEHEDAARRLRDGDV